MSYLRTDEANGPAACSFLMGKCHLTPKLSTTIPRLEMQAAVTALRLDKTIKKELQLPISATYSRSDSSSMLLSVYNSKKRLPVFVANTLAEIERYSCTENWRYVPSELNPADEVSRGVTVKHFIKSSVWICGPEFLGKSCKEWPEQLKKLSELAEDFPLFDQRVESAAILLSVASGKSETLPAEQLIGYFCSLHRLKRAVVWWRRYFQYLKNMVIRKVSLDRLRGRISVQEMGIGECCLIKYEQKKEFGVLVEALEKGTKLMKNVCLWANKKLDPFVCNGILRVVGN